MRATIPKPVIAILALLLVVPVSVGAVSIVSNVKMHTPMADGIRTFTVMVVDDGGKILATGGDELLARYPDQAMTRAEALRSFTLAAAYAAHQEDRLGSLEPGKWADFVIVDRNYFDVPIDQIDDIRVLETWVGGKRVYAYTEAAEAAKR